MISEYQKIAESLGWRSAMRADYEQHAKIRVSGHGSCFINREKNQSYATNAFREAAWKELCQIIVREKSLFS